MKIIRLIAVLLLAAACAAAQDEAGERITSFHSQIQVQRDGTLKVLETIDVIASGERIRHGIYRDFPTDYKDRWGNRFHVKFAMVNATRDGHPEPYRVETQRNGVRIYLGDKDIEVAPGNHAYTIDYTATREIGFFPDHDELYWNATGNGWIFPIDHASADVQVPGVGANQLRLEGYTGPQGSTAKQLTAAVRPDGVANFEATAALGPEEGLTVVVGFPRGIVVEPTRQQKLQWFLEDNQAAVVGLIGLAIVLLYQFVTWFMVGRDPKAGTIQVQYEAPEGLSPAALRYLTKMGFDDQCMSSLIVDMAVKKYLRIEQKKDGKFRLIRQTKDTSNLPLEEERIAQGLLDEKETFDVEQANHTALQSTRKEVQELLRKKEESIYFVRNSKYVIPSIVLTVLTMLAVIATSDSSDLAAAIFMSVWLSGWSVGVAALSVTVWNAWRAALHATGIQRLSIFGALFITAFAVPFFGGEIFGLFMFGVATSAVAVVLLIVLVSSNFLYHELLKAPTHMGRELLDKVDGFKEFLGATEDADRRYAVDHSPQTYEKYLPYAMALDLEKQWTARFASLFAMAAAASAGAAAGYSPSFAHFNDASAFHGLGALGSFSSSFSSAISSASTSPGSSSGFSGGGGGGSSGGGGGGGGGGGW
jgi:uncharacterized membrane protein YgcG